MNPSKAEATPLDPIYTAACQWGFRGVRLLPVEHHTRSAVLPKWQHNASNELPFIDAWWGDGKHNIGLCCGPQPVGWNLLCVDIDNRASWEQLVGEYPPTDRSEWCFHRTPSGGIHLFFDVPPGLAVTGTDVFGPGLDARGGQVDGIGCGYVLLPPSVAASKSTGELLSYGCSPGRGLLDRPPGPAPDWLLDLIERHLRPPEVVSKRRHPSAQIVSSDDPWTWVREHVAWEDVLQRHGWQPDGKYWVRPGKSPRDGHSAELHDDGRLAIWTGEVPNEVRALGTRQSDGGISISIADFIAAYEFDGDRQAFGREYRRRMPPSVGFGVRPTTTPGADRSVVDGLCLPEWFWSQRPWLRHVRDHAWAVGGVPEALLAAVLARIATMIPSGWVIPPIVHDEATFDLMTVIVGHSGTGKSAPMRRAGRMLPCEWPRLRFNLGLGSGEGVAEAYYGLVDEIGADGKVRKVKGRAFDGVHFSIDEGVIMTDLADRKGWTGINFMLTAWSGGTLSTANATTERFRHVEAGTYRFALTMAIQADLAKGLWSDNNVAEGFTGRLTLFSGLSSTVPPPGERPADPGPFDLEIPTQGYPMMLTYPEAFILEVQQQDHARKTLIEDPDPLGAHRNLQRTKLAGIMALMDGRFDVDDTDVVLGTTIVETSENIRSWLQARAQISAQRARDEVNRRQGSDLADREAAQLDRVAARVARALVRTVTDNTDILRSSLRRTLPSRDRKPYFDVALNKLLADGLVVEVDGHIRLK